MHEFFVGGWITALFPLPFKEGSSGNSLRRSWDAREIILWRSFHGAYRSRLYYQRCGWGLVEEFDIACAFSITTGIDSTPESFSLKLVIVICCWLFVVGCWESLLKLSHTIFPSICNTSKLAPPFFRAGLIHGHKRKFICLLCWV